MPQHDDLCTDDPSISASEILWRYIHPKQIVRDPLSGRVKPMSGALRDQRLSVDIASMTTLHAAKQRNPNKGVAQFSVAIVRSMGKKVTQALDLDPGNPAHAVVCPKLAATEARTIADALTIWAEPLPLHLSPPA